ncbi:MAG: isopeptide-forming domain-containing fimbrial protein, partial [Gammaproteobacteria bacterium]|nr:isopeptide-forming domain-containing fimbrial protein [Gammaproteobacteria bacterium]
MKNIIKYAYSVFKTIINRCGIRIANRNAIENSVSMNTANHHVSARKDTCLRSRLLLFFALLFGGLSQALAGEFCVANPQFNGVIDGSVTYTSPSLDTITQITIDGDCTFKNFTSANPLNVTINYQTNDPSIYLISFDNVIFTGNMACSNIDHKLWVVNSPDDAFSTKCQDIIIPAETISKDIPAPTAGIGEPFTYTLTLPSMEFPVGDPSPNDLGNIVLTDDLNALGVDVTVVGTPTVEWISGGAVAHTFTNTGGLLTFDLPNITSGDQIVIKITLVLDDTVTNVAGTQFTNTANWTFSRWIDLDENGIVEDGTVDADGDGIIEDEFFDPLPGENGISLPMTIAEPELVVSKTSTETALNLGIPATFTIDVQNNGGSNAWNTTIVDQLPNIADDPDPDPAGMCDTDPIATISARVFAADGTTPVSGLLAPGTDYSVSYNNALGVPACQLSLTMLTAAAVIGPTERLIISYQSQLDADTTRDSFTLTNIAAATQWFSGDGTYPRITHNKTLTDGTPAVVDHQDSYDITTALSGYYFQKTVQNTTTGTNPATTAAPGDTLGYRLRVFNVDQDINTITITDILDPTKFDTSTFSMIAFPGSSTYSFNSVTGELRVTGFPAATDLNVAQGSELIVDFEIDLVAGLANGDVVPNQATLSAAAPFPTIVSDDPYSADAPYTNNIASPTVDGDENPTRVVIQAPGPLSKVNPATTTYSIGEQFTYTITVPAVAVDVPLYDVRIVDDLTASAADLSFVSANVVSGGSWTLSNTGTSTSAVIEDTAAGIDIPANGQAVIEITVQLSNTTTNQNGLAFNNVASYTYNRSNGDSGTQTTGGVGSTANMTILEPNISTITKVANNTTPTAGEIVRYSVTLTATSGANYSDVFDVTLTDNLDLGLVYEGNPSVTVGTGVSADNTIGAPDITGDGSTTAQTLIWSINNTVPSDIDIVEGETITISYDVRVLNSVLANQALNNSVVAQWSSIDGTSVGERNGVDGTGQLNDYTTAAVTETVTTPDIISTISKVRSSDTYGTGDANVRIGDIVEYTLTLSVPEGTLGNLVLVDTLPQGLDFQGIVSINGNAGPAPYTAVAPFTHADILAANIVEAGDPTAASTTVTWSLGAVTNQPNDGLSDNFVIVYRARVLNNVFAHTDYSISLNNSVTMSYDTASATVTNSDTDTIITALQPQLTVSKSAAPVGGDTLVDAGEVINYTIDVINSGATPVYDLVVQDILPVGLRQGGVTTTSITLVTAGTVLTNFNPAYNVATGIATWNFDRGVADAYTIPAGDTLRIVYQVQVDAGVSQGLTLTNAATATLYYSFDDEAVPSLGTFTGVREIYGPSNTATTTLYTSSPPTKTLTSSTEATIGDQVVYEITVPGTVSTSALHDVQITDALDANLEFISATVTGVAGVTDTSTATQMNIAITEIPAGQQAVIELRARVANVLTAQQGVAINNTTSYTYAFSAGGTTQPALTS